MDHAESDRTPRGSAAVSWRAQLVAMLVLMLAVLAMVAWLAPRTARAAEPEPSGWATWCAPTATKCHGWGGTAKLGAVPSFRDGDEPYRVTVHHGGRSVQVLVVSYCACGKRDGIPTVIDLSPAAFEVLAPTSRGVIRVTLERGGAALPATDA